MLELPRKIPRSSHKHWIDYIACMAAVFAAIAAIFAARYAGQQADISQISSEHQIRAYINAMADDVEPNKNNKENLYVKIYISNIGQTPAYRIRVSFAQSDEKLDTESIRSRLEPQEGTFLLGNNQKFHYMSNLKMTASEYRRMAQSNGRRYVYGSVDYSDVFQKKRKFEFCFYLMAVNDSAHFIPCNDFSSLD